MSTPTPSSRAAVRVFVVVALSLFVVATSAIDLRQLWARAGWLGYFESLDGVVESVDPGSPAAKAGMEVGDRIDFRSTAPQYRYPASNSNTNYVGQSITLALIHHGKQRIVTLTSVSYVGSSAAYRVVRVGMVVLWVFIGAALVLLRPSLTAWGFFLFCIGDTPGNFGPAFLQFQYPAPYVLGAIFEFIVDASSAGGIVFALCFLNEPPTGWRLLGLRLAPWLFVAMSSYGLFDWYLLSSGYPTDQANAINQIETIVIPLLTIAPLIATYLVARGVDRQRIRWIVAGIGLWLLVSAVNPFLQERLPYQTHLWLFHALELSSIVVPITVAYAVLKHRVIDVSFVVSRALVYGILTTLIVGAFSIIDWFFMDKLQLARFGTIAEVGAAIAVGIWFNSLHKRVDSFVDATFFRQRHAAERQLAQNGAALPFVTTTRAIAQTLVREPLRTLSLTSAALFRRANDGGYFREESDGWSVTDISRFDDEDDRFMALIQAQNGPLSLYDHPWRTQGVPDGPARPVLALPIIVRREIAAIVLYGSHVDGEALDPDEIKSIAALATGAAAAYDHLDAESLRTEVETLRGLLAKIRTEPA